jgi:hypothetical protein
MAIGGTSGFALVEDPMAASFSVYYSTFAFLFDEFSPGGFIG